MITIAIDDEPLALQLVTNYILQTPELDFKKGFSNPNEASEYISNNHVDLVFLDVKMPDINGFELASVFPKNIKIILTTAYDNFAIEGFKINAIDYLLKPFGYEEFLNAVQKALKQYELEYQYEIKTNKDFLFIKSDYKIRRIKINEILYIEGLKDYVKIFLKHEARPIITLTSLKTLENKLPSNKFMRIHRSYIINLEQIDVIERSNIIINNVHIPISDNYKENFQQYLHRNFL